MQIYDLIVAVGIPLGSLAFAALIVGLVGYFKNLERMRRHETIRLALEKGQPLPADLLNDDESPAAPALGPAARHRDLARGIQWIFVGVGLSLFLWIFKPERPLWSVGLILLFVGLGKLVSHAVTGRQPPATPGNPAAKA